MTEQTVEQKNDLAGILALFENMIKDYAKQKCKEQCKICLENAGLKPYDEIDEETILDAPEPNFI